MFPNIEKVIKAWREAGKRVIFHADGNRWAILDDIVAMGVDAINPCEELAGMTVRKFKERYPDITIGSVIDCQDLLPRGPVEKIEKASWQLIEDAQDRRVFLGSSSEIHPGIPVEHAMAMYDILDSYHERPRG
jgi:uroporphyrinogen decarboxylase